MDIEIGYVKGDEEAQLVVKNLEEFTIKINQEVITGKISSMDDIFKASVAKLKNDQKNITVSRVKGYISLLSILIVPLPDDEHIGAKEEINTAKTKTYINCPYKDDVIDCAYYDRQMKHVDCPGMFELLDYDDDEKVKCMMKCTDKLPGEKKPSGEKTPEKVETIEEAEPLPSKPLFQPVLD